MEAHMKRFVTLAAVAAAALMANGGYAAMSGQSARSAEATPHSTQSQPAGSSQTLGTHQKPTTTTDTTVRGPAKTGQPGASCETTPNTPGNSASAPGSAFNPDGTAGTKYAGEQPQNSRNT